MVLKRKKNVLVNAICLLPILFQISNIYSKSILYQLGYLMVIIVYYFQNRANVINKKVLIFIFFMLTVYLFIPTLSFNLKLETILYSILIVIFIWNFYIFNRCDRNKNNKLHFKLLISNSIVLILQILKNITQININTLLSPFTGNRLIRADFGFSHPNFVAMFIVINILITYISYKKNYIKKIHMIVLTLVFIIPLFCTGSRTACISLLIFFIVEILHKIVMKTSKNRNIILVLIIIISIIFGYFKFSDYLITNSSGRDKIIINNIEILKKNGDVFLGSGGGFTSNIRNIEGISFSDNWYMTMILQYGVLGIVLFMTIFCVKILIPIFKDKNINSSYKKSLIIMILFYSFAENVLFTPGVEISWYFWGNIIGILFYTKEVKNGDN